MYGITLLLQRLGGRCALPTQPKPFRMRASALMNDYYFVYLLVVARRRMRIRTARRPQHNKKKAGKTKANQCHFPSQHKKERKRSFMKKGKNIQNLGYNNKYIYAIYILHPPMRRSSFSFTVWCVVET